MLKLVSQFDSVRSRSSLATPTCGCCSCCCCCVVTALTSSIITSRMFGKYANKDRVIDNRNKLNRSPESQSAKSSKIKLWPYVVGFFVLPIAIIASFFSLVSGVITAPIFVFLSFYFYVMLSKGTKYSVPQDIIWSIAIITTVLLIIELFAWPFLGLIEIF